MKIIVKLLWVVLLPLQAEAQQNFFKESAGFWQKVELSLPVEAKTGYTAGFNDYDPLAFHFLHFNADSLPDIVYQKDDKVEVFLNNEHSFTKLSEDKGKIIGVQQNLLFSITTFHFIQNDCCINGDNFYQQWIITPADSGVNFNKLERIYFSEGTDIPEFLNINLKFQVNDRSILYSSPDTEGKRVGEYLSRSAGYALSSKIDENNKIWWFVIMAPKSSSLKALSMVAGKRMGWMQSQYLQVER